MPLAAFEPTITVLKRAKTFHALGRAATVAGHHLYYLRCYIVQILTASQNNPRKNPHILNLGTGMR
jgi:hypothetical protein